MIIKVGLALAIGASAGYLVTLWIIANDHRGRRVRRWASRLARRLPALRQPPRREPLVLGWVPPLTATVDHRASADYPDDIDVTTDPVRMAEVRQFLVDRYGEEQVRRLGTFGRAPDA